MDFKLARSLLQEAPKTISLKKIEEAVDKEAQSFFYFDKENTHKQILSLVQGFEKKGRSVYHRVIKYSLDQDDYMYEVHIL
ncbi:HP0268 family nuclease [Campylobacter troglodytis]|uniref:HP0268 family nuclease n=1 Tax=Campylobacter troglodytis TaxID=654363 RepID=UPI00115951F6|nr:HP0268 family nuclease [Campylobacter troglodytis]TQR54193.1 hypothetical protein DMC01_10460 [Campylobacter troglodytis]